MVVRRRCTPPATSAAAEPAGLAPATAPNQKPTASAEDDDEVDMISIAIDISMAYYRFLSLQISSGGSGAVDVPEMKSPAN